MTQKVCIVTPAAQTNGEDLPIAMDSSGNIGVNINTGAGTLAANISTLNGHVVSLDADVQTLFADVAALDIDVKANTAAIAGPSTAMYTGTVTAPIAAGTAIIIGTQACKSVILQAPAGNTQSVMWGASTTTCTMELLAGATSVVINVANVNLIFVKSAGAATQTVNWVARN
jgi:outer membrane murein-binding lipoprotein Lpp